MRTLLATALAVTTLAFALAPAPVLAASDGPYLFDTRSMPADREGFWIMGDPR